LQIVVYLKYFQNNVYLTKYLNIKFNIGVSGGGVGVHEEKRSRARIILVQVLAKWQLEGHLMLQIT